MKNFNNVILLSFGAIFSGVINYLYHPIMLKFLDIKTFGEFESLISIFNILGIFIGGISFFLLKEISKNSTDLKKIKTIFVYSNKFLLLLSIVIYGLFLIISPFISNFLKIDDIIPLNIVGLTIIISFLGIVIGPILQGLEKFKIQAIFGIFGSIIKLFTGVLFVFLGFGLYGAIYGLIISGILTLFISFFYIFKLFKNIKIEQKIIDILKKDFKKDYKDIIQSFLLIFVLSLYMNLDIILVKNLFDNETAGIYSGISVIAKFLIFLGATIETVYYPQIIKSEKIITHFIRNAIGMIMILGIGSIGFFYFFGEFFLELLKSGMGKYNSLLLISLIYCIIYTIISFFAKILIGFKKYIINYLLFVGLFLIFFITKYFGVGNINYFVYTFILIGSILVLIMSIFIFS